MPEERDLVVHYKQLEWADMIHEIGGENAKSKTHG